MVNSTLRVQFRITLKLNTYHEGFVQSRRENEINISFHRSVTAVGHKTLHEETSVSICHTSFFLNASILFELLLVNDTIVLVEICLVYTFSFIDVFQMHIGQQHWASGKYILYTYSLIRRVVVRLGRHRRGRRTSASFFHTWQET